MPSAAFLPTPMRKGIPMDLYQIQTKYRDEKRPRFGVTRAREFIMKDAYTFDADIPGMKRSYEEMWHAYERMFDRMGLEYTVVAGDAGAMGGNSSHEFIALSEVGEGLIAYSSCGYAATDEKARVVYEVVDRRVDARLFAHFTQRRDLRRFILFNMSFGEHPVACKTF